MINYRDTLNKGYLKDFARAARVVDLPLTGIGKLLFEAVCLYLCDMTLFSFLRECNLFFCLLNVLWSVTCSTNCSCRDDMTSEVWVYTGLLAFPFSLLEHCPENAT